MNILRKVDSGGRLSKEELIWLLESEEYYTRELKEGYHRNEARFYAAQYNKTKDYWSAINASSHYRKCGEADTADSMLKTIDGSVLKNKKLKSALFTTYGGVKRDLGEKDEALNLGKKGHLLTPQDFRPCTLLGALNYEIGNLDLGRSWFNKAIQRGYDENSMDNELRSIFMRADKSAKENLCNYLIKIDPVRYGWTKKMANNVQSQKAKR
jgi:Flp pilus assembly protein TadD